jgi:predicted transcriptional regulator
MNQTITPEQSRGARGFLDWSQTKLAKSAKVSLSTVKDFEAGRHVPHADNLDSIVRALERAGIEFTAENGCGLRRRKKSR